MYEKTYIYDIAIIWLSQTLRGVSVLINGTDLMVFYQNLVFKHCQNISFLGIFFVIIQIEHCHSHVYSTYML